MPLQILIVDDQLESLGTLSVKLEKAGYLLDYAKDGLDALGKIQEKKPDVILMDMSMPIIDGVHACEILKDYIYSKDIPIIAISANKVDEDIKKAKEAGCAYYFTKPVSFRFVEEAIKKVTN